MMTGNQHSKRPNEGKKTITSLLLSLLAFVTIFGSVLASPLAANAQLAVSAPVLETQGVVKEIKATITDNIVEAAVTSVVSGVNYFTTQLAYQAAVALTTSCNGQTICWDSKSFSSGFTQAWQGAIGEAVGTLSSQSGLTKLGFNLCSPSLGISLKIQLGLLDELKPPPPKCDFNQLTDNWSNFKDSMTGDQLLKSLTPTFSQGQSPLSASLGIFSKMAEVKANSQRNSVMKALMDASSGGGFSGITDPVSGRVKSPASVTQDEFTRMKKAQQDDPKNYSATIAAGQIAKGAVMSVVINTVQTFTQTLVSRMWNKLSKGLLSTEELVAAQPDLVLNPDALLSPSGTSGMEIAASARMQSVQTRDAGVIDPILEFSTCPTAGRVPDNCVIDQQFANAIRVADVTPLTVRDAIKQGLLHGDWPLISANDQSKNQDPYCYSYGYCESNLRKLRAARIIPIGWEIVANLSPSGKPLTLQAVVDEFNNCNDQGGADDQHRFCKMIDPDWILRAPLTQCRAMGYGEQTVSPEVPTRSEICLDKQTCLKQDDSGKCIGGWGYCTKERNIWRFNADSCPEQFNTCRVLTARTGGARSYDLNTIDHGVCNADNVGCRSYSTSLNVINCNYGSTCNDPKGCSCAVITASCTVLGGQSSCTVAETGKVCRLSGVCSGVSCPCSATATCTVKSGDSSCSSVTGSDASAGDDWLADPVRYLNQKAQTCDAGAAGCTALIRLSNTQSLNLVRNGGFETLEDGDNGGSDNHAAFWAPFATVPSGTFGSLITDGSKSTSGTNAILVKGPVGATSVCTLNPVVACTADGGCPCTDAGFSCKVVKGTTSCSIVKKIIQTGIRMRSNVTYTLSFDQIPVAGKAVSALASLTFYDNLGKPVSLVGQDVVSSMTFSGQDPANPPTGTCAVSAGHLDFSYSGNVSSGLTSMNGACTFVVSRPVASASLQLADGGGGGAYVDNVQLEEGGGTSFHEGYGDTGGTVDAKIPPDYLGCTGDATDRPECASFAGVCRENEMGCDGYAPTNGDPSIPAIVGPQDSCPKECVGYDVFKQEASDFDQEKFPVAFIPSTAKVCAESEAGCSEFTNIDTEAVSYYSHLRMCVKTDDPSVKVFYSWEGSDTTGYQLHVWNLKQTAAVILPTASDVCATANCAPTGKAGAAPCTKLDGNAQNCASVDSMNVNGSIDGLCSRADIDSGNFDCREFYDADGNRHYRLLSKTIIASAQCFSYRITTSTQLDCANSNGRWDSDKSQCIYSADTTQSASCGAAQNNCRAYKGNASTNVRTIFSDDFEGGIQNWTNSTDTGSGLLAQSPESVTVGGHSMKIPVASVDRTASVEVGGMVAASRSYSLTFWARGTGNIAASFRDGTVAINCALPSACANADGCSCSTKTGLTCTVAQAGSTCTIATGSNPKQNFAPTAVLSSEWKQFSLGPIISTSKTGWGTSSVKFELSATATSDVFIDNVRIKEVQDNIFVVRNSWTTPASCDTTSAGAPSPQEMLGCKEYVNTAGQSVDLRSFSRLCREKAIGCAAYSDTRNTPDNPYAESFNAVCRLTLDDGVTPRSCGSIRCNAALCASNNGCSCTTTFANTSYSCTITKGSTFCDKPVSPDGGASCVCNYDTHHPAAASSAPVLLPDVCRVAVGQSDCRFKLDSYDTSTRADESPDRVNVDADRRVYLVAKGENMCTADQIGCAAVGQPHQAAEAKCDYKNPKTNDKCGAMACAKNPAKSCTTNSQCAANDVCAPASCSCTVGSASCQVKFGEGSCTASFERPVVDKWNASVVKDLPSQYGSILCRAEADGCDAFSSTDGVQYFKDPGDRTCAYKEGVSYNNQTISGWFRKSDSGQDFPCYPELLKNGNNFEIYKNADPVCQQSTQCADPDGCACYLPGNATSVCKITFGGTVCGYQGWVGECSAQYDRCEEFVDPSATSATNPKGLPYYYLKNSKLDVQSCSGSVSLKEGCVAFKQTSDPSDLYSAATSYYKSQRDAQNGKVSPVNCDLNPYDPACDFRCASIPAGVCAVDSKFQCHTDTDCKRCSNNDNLICSKNADCGAGTCGAIQTCTGIKKYTSACQLDGDCNRGTGETCQNIGNVGNDANIIIKVNPDRECAEWLACRSYSTVWDDQKGQYRSVCSGFGPCTQNKQLGQAFDCVAPVEPPKSVFSSEDYSKRDTSWGGLEYSGYTIPDRYSPAFLLPLNIVKGRCMIPGKPATAVVPTVVCTKTEDCQSSGKGNFCQQLSGICLYSDKGLQGESCDVNADCGTGASFCSYNFLATHRYATVLDRDKSCGDDSDCTKTKTGYAYDGACVDHHCAYDPSGDKFNTNNSDWAPRCRAYPEADSPFGASVLDNSSPTSSSGSGTGYDSYGQAKSKKGAFVGANVCGNGNDCACNYSKWTYGKGSALSHYLSYPGTTASGPVVFDGNTRQDVTTGPSEGVCVGGPNEGLKCDASQSVTTTSATSPGGVIAKVNDPCNSEGGGKCQKLSTVNYEQGWEGFCLDLDKSLNVGGDPNKYDCNLWMPVDRLEGAPDNYNQFEGAGFNPPNSELLYCSVAQGLALGDFNNPPAAMTPPNPPGPPAPYFYTVVNEPPARNPIAPYNANTTPANTFFPRIEVAGTEAWSYDQPFSSTSVWQDQIVGIFVDGNYSCENTSKPSSAVSFYLTAKNNWTNSVVWDDSIGPVPAPGLRGDNLDPGCWYGDAIPAPSSSDQNNDSEQNAVATGIAAGHLDCVGLKAIFTNGKLTSFHARNMTASNKSDCGGAFLVKVSLLLRDSCQEVSQVHNATTTPRNFAWTDRLYQGSLNPSAYDSNGLQYAHVSTRTGTPTLSPYGNISPDGLVMPNGKNLDAIRPLSVWASEGGSPYSFLLMGSEVPPQNPYHFDAPNQRTDNSVVNDVGGYPFACIGPCGAPLASNKGVNAGAFGEARLAQYFVTSLRRFEYNDAGAHVYSQVPGGGVYDVSSRIDDREQNAAGGDAPKVVPVNRSNCDGGQDGLCDEGTVAGLTVNDNQGSVDEMPVETGKTKATIYFYAYADKNRMPIRSVRVDYGDGSSPDDSGSSAFKNHRGCKGGGVCGTSPDVALCGSASVWGLTPESCDSHYFQKTHTYVCTPDMISPNPAIGLPLCNNSQPVYPCQQGNACHFKPRVQVIDNWGFCNGTCQGLQTNGQCFNKGDANVADLGAFMNSIFSPAKADVVNSYDPNKPSSSCVSPVANNECEDLSSRCYKVNVGSPNGASQAPWTAFGHDIVLKP